MEPRKNVLLSVALLAGLALIIMVYQPSLPSMPKAAATVVGLPPPLSDFPPHGAFINEETCLNCHAEGKALPAFGLTAPKIKHEPRENCVSCHALPSRT
ncbi:MAG: hypothetical protein IID15_09500 [Candidatus Marinimicrobia bacterium]|nr:hypothetical protein [Candidatus Neomarinimicrobiota bacterium]